MNKTQTESQIPTKPLRVRDVDEDYAAISVKCADLVAKREVLYQKIGARNKEFNGRVARGGSPTSFPQHSVLIREDVPQHVARAQKARQERIAAHLGELAPTVEPPPPTEMPTLGDPKVVEMVVWSKEADEITAALAVLDPLYQRRRAAAQRKLCELLLPAYRKIAAEFAEAVIGMGNAIAKNEAFLQQHGREDLVHIRLILAPHSFTNPESKSSELWYMIKWLLESGHIDRSIIPSTWGTKP